MITYQTLSPAENMKVTQTTEISQPGLEVISHKGAGLEWEKPEDSGEDVYTRSRKVFKTGDGLRYILLIEETNLDVACGDIMFSLSGTLPKKTFETKEEATQHKDALEAEGVDTHDMDIEEEPVFVVTLYVVPVSLPKDIEVFQGDMWSDARQYRQDNGDWGDYYLELHIYGIHIPVWSKTCLYDSLGETNEEASHQAVAVQGLFGFYMDRPVNRMGETGWDHLKRFRAFEAQHEVHEPKEEMSTKTCDSCGEETTCGVYDTIYDIGVPICEGCLEMGWVGCADCGLLIPIRPQSYQGCDWMELDGRKHCKRCGGNFLDLPEHNYIIKGGAYIRGNDLSRLTLDLVGVVANSWDLVDDWYIGFSCRHGDQLAILGEVNDVVKEAQYSEEFMLGIISRGQFDSKIGLFKRCASQ